MSDPQSLLPTSVEGRAVVAICPVYHWDDRTEFVAVTEWDDPTPYVLRYLTVSHDDGETHRADGEYHFSLASALRAFRERIPLA
jgi:hypothetical protein